jgi:predicted HTH domain antitoxin
MTQNLSPTNSANNSRFVTVETYAQFLGLEVDKAYQLLKKAGVQMSNVRDKRQKVINKEMAE